MCTTTSGRRRDGGLAGGSASVPGSPAGCFGGTTVANNEYSRRYRRWE